MNICRSKDGHVKLWYKMADSDIAQDNTAYIVFIRMLFLAHYEDDFTSIRFNGKQYYLKAGEFSASFDELSALTKVNLHTLRRVILRLVDDKRISKRTDRQTTIFSICNWHKYQGDKRTKVSNDIPNDIPNDVANDMPNVTEGKKNIKNIKNIKKEINKEKKVVKKSNDDVTLLLQLWQQYQGRPASDNKTTRTAIRKLLSLHTVDEIEYAIKGAAYFKGMAYKPQVLSFNSLYEKWDNLLGHMDATVKERSLHASNRFE